MEPFSVDNNSLKISQLKYKKRYLAVLRAAVEYDYLQGETIKYNYSYDEEDIISLVRMYDIDALRAENEFVTFLNAVNWVSSTLNSSGLPKGPSVNSVKIIRDVVEGKNAANCYAHAVVLNDVLCALGFKCKYVFCYPIDLYPTDCHVVNLVYSNEDHRWILLDSANNVFFSDEWGNVLDIEELRDRLIHEKEVRVNLLNLYDNINEQKKALIRQKILIYMLKNMYRFGCYENSQRDGKAENTNINFYHLIPLGYMDVPGTYVEYDLEKRVKRTEHYIMNPRVFWKIPDEKNDFEG